MAGTVCVFFGLIASGKSYLAKAWAEKHDFPYYNSDVVRKELAGLSPTESQKAVVDGGIYSPEFSRRTYDKLLELAGTELDNGSPCVVLDGSYQSSDERKRLMARFSGQNRVIFILCRCDEGVMKKRLDIRAADPNAVSDGRWEIYLKQKERFSRPVELKAQQLLVVDTDNSLESLTSLLDRELGDRVL